MDISSLLLGAIHQTWNQIGLDSQQCADECGEPLTNEAALEGCIDADRMVMYGGANGKVANEQIKQLIAQHGYDAVMRQLKKRLRLI